MSVVLLLALIIGLFLLRVPMAFAILGPCLAYLLIEDLSVGLTETLTKVV